jgi:hypothetical protein
LKQEGFDWFPTFLMHKRNQKFEIVEQFIPVVKKEAICRKCHVAMQLYEVRPRGCGWNCNGCRASHSA